MAVERRVPAHSTPWPRGRRLLAGGNGGNERLTSATGALLIVLPGRSGRTLSLLGALTFGGALAIVVVPQFAPWLSAHHFHH
jgi:hypothetical protein